MGDNMRKELTTVLKELENTHFPCGPDYTRNHKLKAILCMKDDELEAIYNLVESHAPSLRFTAMLRYVKALDGEAEKSATPLNKENLNFNCGNATASTKVQKMLQQLEEMPKEWTIVQLTSQFNVKESVEVTNKNYHTNPLHITVFKCNLSQTLPFTVTIDVPKDKISSSNIEIRKELQSILMENINSYHSVKNPFGKFVSDAAKQDYCKIRFMLNKRMENLVEQIQNNWLSVWRCLLLGRLVDDEIENGITALIDDVLSNEDGSRKTDKIKNLLRSLFNGADCLTIDELKAGLRYIFPDDKDKDLRVTLGKIVQDFAKQHVLSKHMRHPVILIVDEKLDFIPWEMLDVLQNHPVSRMPSLHFAYALFKEHKDSIVDGWKININPNRGNYIINPGLDLKKMEARIGGFIKYWLPNWSGLVGVKPSEDEFQKMISESDVFLYSGHGNGTQFLAGEKIQKLKVNAVVFLFGCGSVQLQCLGPQVEMYSSYYMYLIACSPCVVGSLWAIPDMDTDIITAEVLSQWIPSKAPTHWRLVDEKKWRTHGNVCFATKKATLKENDKHEPELLRAIHKARRSARQYLVQAAFVVRGLPVKIAS